MEKDKKIGTCALCKQQTELCKSHIVPELVYKHSNMFDESSKTPSLQQYTVNLDDLKGTPKERRIFTGAWEYLLCRKHEDIFRDFESYVSKVTYAKSSDGSLSERLTPIKTLERERLSVFENIEYKPFKLYFLSILWRASVSSHFMFKDFEMFADEEEKLRQMLLDENPGLINYWYISIEAVSPKVISPNSKLLFQDEPIQGVVCAPYSVMRPDGLIGYMLFLGNLIVHFTNKPIPELISAFRNEPNSVIPSNHLQLYVISNEARYLKLAQCAENSAKLNKVSILF
jgi:hypothetical protein